MDSCLVGIILISSTREWIDVLRFWIVLPLSLNCVGYCLAAKHIAKNLLWLGVFYLLLNVFLILLHKLLPQLRALRLLLRRVALCNAYVLLGFPLDVLAVIEEVIKYLLQPLLGFLALPFLLVVETFHGRQLEGFLNAFRHTLLPWLLRCLL